MGVKGLNQCQRRWWKHVSPQRKLEIQTSIENTAPDMQMSQCLQTDGTKQKTEAARERQTEDRNKSKETEEDLVNTESFLGHLEAAHAIKQSDREMSV